MSRRRVPCLRKSVLSLALGVCLSTLAIAPAYAQSAMGAVAGRASAGDQITLVNAATGTSRTVTVSTDGSYRLSQLPVGDYTLRVVRGGNEVGEAITVNVALGGTTNVNLSGDGGLTSLDTIEVVSSRVVNRVDVYSTESATNITREELARLPVDQSLASVALLAPGVVSSGATFGGLTFGGSSVAENAVYINGLNVTDPYLRQGFSSVPFAFFQEVQVKTGGYSAEFGRSTGGVINSVTRSGSNAFQAGVEFTMEPASWTSVEDDHFYENGQLVPRDRTSRDTTSFYKANVWASGALVKDRLFFFGMYEWRDYGDRDYDTVRAWHTNSDNGFWGGKIDWQINDDHRLELLAFSDKADSVTTTYNDYEWESDQLGDWSGEGTTGSGGDNWSATYIGNFGENFVAKAMYGVNKRSSLTYSSLDGECSIISVAGSYTDLFGRPDQPLGCHPRNSSVNSRFDEREAMRLDFEWTLGNHLLRFGLDQEQMNSTSSRVYPGTGMSYQVQGTTPGAMLGNGSAVPDGVTAIVDARHYITGTPVDTDTQAIYLEDNWSVTPNLLLSIGVRADKFHNKLASGMSFAKADFSDMISPRVGFSWDMRGDGTTKLFGNAGRYYIPLTNKLTDYFGGGTTDEHIYYVFNGWTTMTHPVTGNAYLLPSLGAQIGPVDDDMNVPAPDDIRTEVARDLKQVFQDEYILGFQQAINQTWSYGVNATYRKVTRAVEDARINHVEGCPWYSGDWPIINPGEATTLWCPDTNDWVTFDSSQDGYIASASGMITGYPKPRRTYKAVEFQIDRAWDDTWAFNASYIWSKTEGNLEGPVNSDTGYADTNLVQHYDHPANNERHGVLFNDFRHQFKLRGSYKFNDMWTVGSTLSVRSGGPITAFGVVWPNDNRVAGGTGEYSGGGSGWLCMARCNDPRDGTPWSYADRDLVWSERGAFGRMPWVYDLGANVTWTLPVEGIDLKARLSVYNLLNRQTVINVHSRHEGSPGIQLPFFGQGTNWQAPRSAQLVVSYTF